MDYFFGAADKKFVLIGGLIAGLASLAWGVYALKKRRICLKHEGWVTREESPKTFWFHSLLYIVVGVGLVVATLCVLLGK